MHEVHRPDLVEGLWHCQWLRPLTHQTLSGFDAQVQFQLSVDAIHALVVPAKPFDIAQIQVAQPESPVAVVVSQADQPINDERVLSV